METILPYLSSVDAFLDDFPSRISVALIIIFFSLSFLLIFYLLLAYKRLEFIYFRARKKYWGEVLTNILTDFLSIADGDEIADPVSHILREMKKLPLHSRFIREMLYQQILDFHHNFTGTTAENLRLLFLKLDLHKITEKRLHSGKDDIKIRGMIDTAQMQLHQFIPLITKQIHSESPEVRIEAQATYIILNKQHSFDFLGHIKEPILDWHQLVLLELATQINTRELPVFSIWLNSENRSVVELCVKLIGHFQQFQATEKLITLLHHPDQEIQLLVIRVLGEFEATEAEDSLLKLYANGNTEVRAEVIKALGRTCSGNHMDFLLKEAKSREFDIVWQSLNALRNHGDPGLGLIRDYYTQAAKMNKEIIEHVLDTVNLN